MKSLLLLLCWAGGEWYSCYLLMKKKTPLVCICIVYVWFFCYQTSTNPYRHRCHLNTHQTLQNLRNFITFPNNIYACRRRRRKKDDDDLVFFDGIALVNLTRKTKRRTDFDRLFFFSFAPKFFSRKTRGDLFLLSLNNDVRKKKIWSSVYVHTFKERGYSQLILYYEDDGE